MLDSVESSGDDGGDDMEVGIIDWSRIDEGGKPARRTMKQGLEGEEEGRSVRKKDLGEPEFKIIFKFREAHEIAGVSPITLTNHLKKSIGDIKIAKVLHDGALLVICKDEEQKGKAVKLQAVCKKQVVEKK